jgi:hypothetical protein
MDHWIYGSVMGSCEDGDDFKVSIKNKRGMT